MDERLKKVTTVTIVTAVDTTFKRYKVLLFSILKQRLRPLRPFLQLIFMRIIHSVFNGSLNTYFFSREQLENYRHGCNQLFNFMVFRHLHFSEVVTEVVTVVTKSHNYLQINKLRF